MKSGNNGETSYQLQGKTGIELLTGTDFMQVSGCKIAINNLLEARI